MPLKVPDPTDLARRVALTAAVRDTDVIEKVEDAGTIRVLEDGRRTQVMHNGLLIDEHCYGEVLTGIIEELRGHHEPQEELVFHELLARLKGEGADPKSRTMIELGAFWAYYSMWFATELPGSRTVMVEPDPHNLEVGKKNFALNGIETGDWIHAAVGFDDGGEIWLACESDDKVRKVPTVTLEGILRERGLDHCDLLLCDTQGAELAVLEASRDAITAGKLRFAMISTHHQLWSGDALTHQRCLALVEDLGGHVIAEHSISESCSGDGLIAVSFDPRDADLTVPVTHVRAKDSLFGEPEFALADARGWRGPARHYGGRAVRKVQSRLRRAS
ncbi:MAG: FkbM family methyltransferase [Solirubrobacteraceae bacterium]|nr:FkbM family methyltransferase [Solirubrobacteraceae bacterium]